MVVVPTFYGTYTSMGLINSIIYMDEIGTYPGWAMALVLVGIGVLIYGVMLLSAEKSDKPSENSSPQTTLRTPADDEELGDVREIPLPSTPATAKSYSPPNFTPSKHTRMFSEDEHDFVYGLPGSSMRDSGECLTGTLLRKDSHGRIIVDSTGTGLFRRGGKAKLKGAKGVAYGFKAMLSPQRYKNLSTIKPSVSTLAMETSVPDYGQEADSYSTVRSIAYSGSGGHYAIHSEPGAASSEDDAALRKLPNPSDAFTTDAYNSSDLHLDMLYHPTVTDQPPRSSHDAITKG